MGKTRGEGSEAPTTEATWPTAQAMTAPDTSGSNLAKPGYTGFV